MVDGYLNECIENFSTKSQGHSYMQILWIQKVKNILWPPNTVSQVSTISNKSSETTRPILTKFHIESPGVLGMNIAQAVMVYIAGMPVYDI